MQAEVSASGRLGDQEKGKESRLVGKSPGGNASSPYDCDVFVIGAGPAGSTAAILLAERGYRVVLSEKSFHPRFHIGESLLPANVPLLDRLGVREQIEKIGMQKWGVEFVSPWHDRSITFQFTDALDKSLPYSYQVRRSEFDEILFRRAAQKGAETIEGCRVREVDLGDRERPPTVRAILDDGSEREWRVRFLIDATGRDTLVANRLGIKRRNRAHNSAALYAHFRFARRHEGRAEGNITIFWFEHGWFWFIPLRDGATSVGAVVWPYYMKTRSKPLPEFFSDTIALCPQLANRLEGAEIASPVEATGNYSYAAEICQGDNFVMLGDAFAFIDPVFSSGVWLAMNSALAGVDVVEARIREPVREAAMRRRFEHVMRHGPRQFSWFIYRVTNPTMRELFMAPGNAMKMKSALLSVLAGDIFGRTRLRRPLAAFRAVYYAFCVANLRRTFAAQRRRAFNIGEESDIGMGSR